MLCPVKNTYSTGIRQSQSIRKAKVEIRFALRDEFDARAPILCVGHQTSLDGGLPHLSLLRSAPAIGLSQDEYDVVLLERCPDSLSVHVRDVLLGAPKEVLHVVAEELNNGFVGR